ncbi:MAG: helix-turn-helix domain-containing protein [Alphaproteobacteria bacterium]|nr:helix-turn-helix domain-containing protein [Alphaproteobacteria bacterium]
MNEVTQICHCHYTTLLDYIHSGVLPACKVGRQWIITEDTLAQFIEMQENKTLQAVNSKKRIRTQCCINETKFGMPITQMRAAKELDARLAQPTNKQPLNYTIKSSTSNGGLTA